MATQTQRVSHAPPHGLKRPLDEDGDHAQRLAKRFHLLNLENQQNGKLWVPSQQQAHAQPDNQPPPPAQSESELMNVDDTKNRVYIHDLDAELASVSDADEEERVIFLPDIERRLNRVPHRVLAEERTEEPHEQQMVLYNVPHSLSVPAEHDNVRKAIIESRARTREQQRKGDVALNPDAIQSNSMRTTQPTTSNSAPSYSLQGDPDAMDLG